MASREAGFLNALRDIKHGSRQWLHRRRRERALAATRRATGGRVAAGPFAGLVLDPRAVSGGGGAKLLGTYEKELHPALERIAATGPARVIDVGAAEGYYALGLARSWGGPVIAFEALEHARGILAANADRNGLAERVEIHGACDEGSLLDALGAPGGAGLLVMDVEGAELELIGERAAGALGDWQILVETHDFSRPGCLAELERRLAPTHRLERVESRRRTPADFPLALPLADADRLELMDEGRPGAMTWLVARPSARDPG